MSELTPASVKKLKVAELRSELSNLGLDTKGNKPVLVKRLLEAISGSEGEGDGEENSTDNADDSQVTTEEDSQDESAKPEVIEKPEESEKPVEEASAPSTEEEKVEPEPMEATTTETTTNESEVEQTSAKEEVTETPTSANDTEMTAEDSEKTQDESEESKVEATPSEETKQEEEGEQKSESANRKRGLLDTPITPPQPGKVVDLPKDVDFDVTVEFSKVEEEPEVELDESLVVLNTYTNDLFVKVNPEATSCGTMRDECFLFMAGGARATYGVTSGKVCYEIKVTELHDAKLPETEVPKNFVRVGWSVQAANLQLGEDEHSYGYDSNGKKCNNSEFSDFGQTFDKDDVVTCYLDLESEVKKISFSKNGEDVGDAFELPEDVEGKAFFPHVYLKNSECSFNFGAQEEASFAPKEGFSFIQNAPDDSKVQGMKGPAEKGDCEVLMMIGLPASGKTTWVKKYTAENPEKNYNVLGTSVVLDKMKLMGVARKQEYGGFNKHMDKAAKCLHRLFEIAPSKKRNYILDQTNVYMTAQSKKMKSFEGFKSKAIVCIPTQETLKERMEQKKKEGTELPFNAICDMKRNFFLPKVGDQFDEITYVDQDEEQSTAIIAEYAKEVPPSRPRTSSGGYQPDRKRPRHDDRSRHGGYGGGGGGKWSGGQRDYYRRDDRSGNRFQPYNRRGGYGSPQFNRYGGGGGGGRGGFRDNRSGGGRGGYQGGGYQGGGYQGGSSYNDRNRHGGYKGGNRNYGGGNKGPRGGSNYGSNYGSQQRQYNYSNTQQTSSFSPQQPQQQDQQQQQQNYNYSQYYQQAYQQAYGQQPQQNTAATQQTQAYQQQPQQYANYYQQGTYPQGYSYGY